MRTTQSKNLNLPAGLASGAHIAVITGDYNAELTSSLERACLDTLTAHGVPVVNIHSVHVPGALEIPVVASRIAAAGEVDAVIALGVILRGETYHFELVADQCAAGLQQVAVQHRLPVINEVLACHTLEQAQARATGVGNKGIEAAITALRMIAVMRDLDVKFGR